MDDVRCVFPNNGQSIGGQSAMTSWIALVVRSIGRRRVAVAVVLHRDTYDHAKMLSRVVAPHLQSRYARLLAARRRSVFLDYLPTLRTWSLKAMPVLTSNGLRSTLSSSVVETSVMRLFPGNLSRRSSRRRSARAARATATARLAALAVPTRLRTLGPGNVRELPNLAEWIGVTTR